jgi:hypothetical protein
MNKQNRYLIYILFLIATIPAVMLLFKMIEPKKLASLFAASLFISASLVIIWGELKNKTLKTPSLIAAIGFLILFSAPMLIVRILNYDQDFSSLTIGPLTAPEFHKYSNYGFMMLLLTTVVDYFRSKKSPPPNISKPNALF